MDRPTGSSHLSYSLGVLAAVGGLTGFLKTGSSPSLIAGLGIGGLYIYGGYLINVSYWPKRGNFNCFMPTLGNLICQGLWRF